ncbi:TetR/AcrR family transcriptional regulator [Croceicoccus gelatinilyticus]|uniref:TetR/AcrR family transcriptional regulator n=1 Tax=Croceicoccus gelatinilyticus TaxID=2835536 RepID=UPI001BCE087B|nr:TetR/AcrR family transcriptional regulator [Croceicoccus gelatinilyticus]MBS7671223.1 TetR/AcrR family transcriptional regulator [Croceicoccus gelatinilyticus]
MTTQTSGENERGARSRLKMILVAEELFAREGINEVSLRSIASAAGQSNVAAVQYHFGGRDGLLRAIFDQRVREMEVTRRARLEQLGSLDAIADRDLLGLVYEPYLDLTNEAGDHCYARLLLTYLTRFGRHAVPHPAEDETSDEFVIPHILAEVRRRLEGHETGKADARTLMMTTGFLSLLCEHDVRRAAGMEVGDIRELADWSLDLMAATFSLRG